MNKLIGIFKVELENLPNASHVGEKKSELIRLYKLIEHNDLMDDLFEVLSASQKETVIDLLSN